MDALNTQRTAHRVIKSTIDRSKNGQAPRWLRLGFRLAAGMAPGLAARLGQWLLFTPPRPPLRQDERAVLVRSESFSLPVRGRPVAGYLWGAGPTVLLVHGWGGHAGHMTAFVKPLLAAGFRVVALDMPGHGASAGRLSSLVHVMAAIEGAAALFQPVHGLVAHSLGAAAATNVLARGLRVERAVFVAPPARFEPIWARFRAAVGMPDAIWRHLVARAQRWLKVRFDDLVPASLAPRMHLPLLVLHDADDSEIALAEGEAFASLCPDAGFEVVEGLGHLRILKDWRVVDRAVRFLRQA